MAPRVVAIIQARTGSTRLPGKVLAELVPGRSMISLVVERALHCASIGHVVVAIPESDESTLLPDAVIGCGAELFLGHEFDVLDRYYQAAKAFRAEHVVRITSDCPLVGVAETDALVEMHISRSADFTHNVTVWGAGMPLGTGAEVFRMETLEAAWRFGREAHHREHVDEFVYEHPERFLILKQVASPRINRPEYRLTVDTAEDLGVLRQLYAALYCDGVPIPLEGAVAYLDDHPHILDLNRHVVQKVV
jgi:spore coat polysaccharide biosynthesis protein SpsF